MTGHGKYGRSRQDAVTENLLPICRCRRCLSVVRLVRLEKRVAVTVCPMSRLVLEKIIQSLFAGREVQTDELVHVLSAGDPGVVSGLHTAADQKRLDMTGDAVLLRGIIEISNICIQNCQYCGLRKDNRRVHRYRMPAVEVLEAAKRIMHGGISTVVLQSGEDLATTDSISTLVRTIKSETGLTVTLSLGERDREDYRRFREAGAERYLLKHETASRPLFETMRPGSSYENRRQCLQWLKELGFETGAGNMIGLPGQCMTDLAMDLHYLNALQPDMIGIGPFIPHPETPLAQYPPGSSPLTLRVVALSRLLVPQANIPATTALGVLDKSGRINALHAGANVVMLDFTPVKYRRFYDIYPGKARALTEMDPYLPILREELAAIGRPVG